MKKHKIILNDYCVRVIESPVRENYNDYHMADGYSLSTTYKVEVDMTKGETITITGQQFMEFQEICRRWFTNVCLDSGFTSVKVEEAE